MKLDITSTQFKPISNVHIPDSYFHRLKTDNEKIDAFFGGGILPGSTGTITAKPGLGKTTWVLQLLQLLKHKGYKTGYCTNEESIEQIALTCRRINVHTVNVCSESNIDIIAKYLESNDILVVDSFQGLTAPYYLSPKALEEYCVNTLVKKAKATKCVLILVCHNTKAGKIKGSSSLIHSVDINIEIDHIIDAQDNARAITAQKNRFGPATTISCLIQYAGYDYEGDVIVEEVVGNIKTKRKDEEREKILNIGDIITISAVCTQLHIDSTRAGYILRELTTEGKLIKSGRGNEAKWIKPDITIEEK